MFVNCVQKNQVKLINKTKMEREIGARRQLFFKDQNKKKN